MLTQHDVFTIIDFGKFDSSLLIKLKILQSHKDYKHGNIDNNKGFVQMKIKAKKMTDFRTVKF